MQVRTRMFVGELPRSLIESMVTPSTRHLVLLPPVALRPASQANAVALPGAPCEALTCRLCWSEGDAEQYGQLISPCACSGSMAHIHVRCLRGWQQELLSRGDPHVDVSRCELCHQPYRWPRGCGNVGPSAAQRSARHATSALRALESILGVTPTYTPVGHALGLAAVLMRAHYLVVVGLVGFQAGAEWGAAPGRRRLAAAVAVRPTLVAAACGALCSATGVLVGLRLMHVRSARLDLGVFHTIVWLRRKLGFRGAHAVLVGGLGAGSLYLGVCLHMLGRSAVAETQLKRG